MKDVLHVNAEEKTNKKNIEARKLVQQYHALSRMTSTHNQSVTLMLTTMFAAIETHDFGDIRSKQSELQRSKELFKLHNWTHPNAQRNMVPRAVLMKTDLKPFNTARTTQSTVKRPYQSKTVITNKKFTQKNNTASPKEFNTARAKAVNTARPHSAVVNAVRVNLGKPQQDDTGFIDSGCSRHMTGNIAYLSDFKEFDGGYVTFRGGAHGGRMFGKGTLKTDSLDLKMYTLSMS
ncbi:hypothetical protein Tco_0920544 [Tanacetum coccineum]